MSPKDGQIKGWEKSIIHVDTTVLKAMEAIESSADKFGVVVDDQEKVIGTITDGDLRRALLAGKSLDSTIDKIMNPKPVTLPKGTPTAKIRQVMTEGEVSRIPLVDKDGKLDGIFAPADFKDTVGSRDNPVVLMAGGLGSRLGELTKDTPKPMLKVGKRPILEIILEDLIDHGFRNFYFSVNYKKESIKEYFQDGSKWGAKIQYLEETKKLGTAGALGLLTPPNDSPLLVMNGDILTKVDFSRMLKYHLDQKSVATMGVRNYQIQIPYGVIKTDGEKVKEFQENPIRSHFVNAGIYILNNSLLQSIPKDEYYDMTSLFESALKDKKKTCAFPLHEYWMDIGQRDDLEKARSDFSDF